MPWRVRPLAHAVAVEASSSRLGNSQTLVGHTTCPCGQWPCGLMDKALVFGTKDCRFESCQGHTLLWML